MRKFFHWKSFLIFLVVASGIGLLVSKWFNVGFWLAFIIIAIAICVVGWIAFFEDELPGGFDNPRDHEENR